MDATIAEAATISRKKRKGGPGKLDGHVDQGMSTKRYSVDRKLLRFIIHANMSFANAEDPYLKQYLYEIRPSYEGPKRFPFTHTNITWSRTRMVEHQRIPVGGLVPCVRIAGHGGNSTSGKVERARMQDNIGGLNVELHVVADPIDQVRRSPQDSCNALWQMYPPLLARPTTDLHFRY
ncbi:hypothetical protein FB451DRAFT_1163900 [Mycena latifolia]|nr:hypothetical protein FB451DRAFT_1163900 [Mycena latifolia]